MIFFDIYYILYFLYFFVVGKFKLRDYFFKGFLIVVSYLYKLNISRRCENMDVNKILRYKIVKFLYYINCLNFYIIY